MCFSGAGTFGDGCPVLARALHVTWQHMDSPVEGVRDNVLGVYHATLALHAGAAARGEGTKVRDEE